MRSTIESPSHQRLATIFTGQELHLQHGGINPEYSNVLSQTYPSETKTNDTKGYARLMRWASLTHLHKRAYEYSDQFKL